MGSDGITTKADLEKWQNIFANNTEISYEEAMLMNEIELEEIDHAENNILFVKLGNEEFQPTLQELENFRKVFDEAKDDPDFKIFTHSLVSVESIPVGKVIAID